MGKLIILTFHDLLVETVHILSSKRGHQGGHFIEYTTDRPDVTSVIIGSVFPNFWRRVVRSTRLSVKESFFGNFGNIQVT